MKNQNSKTDPIQSSTKVNPRQSATMAGPRKVVKNKPKKDDYQSQLDSLFDNDMNNNQTKNISAPSELYSDISSDESYDSDDEACSENEVDVEKAENENVLESMKDFISSDEKTGPKINPGLASYMNQGLRTRVNEEKYKDLTKKYDKPANVSSLKVPRVNIGIWKQMSLRNKDVDIKLQRLQNLLSKTACPLMYMMDMFVEKSSKKEGMSREELQAYAVTCRDTYQLFQACYSEITFRRRSFIKDDIQPQYKGLCDDTTPVTDMLFGDDIKEKIKELDAEHSVCKKVGKDHNYTYDNPKNSYQSSNRGRSHHGHGGRGFPHKFGKRKRQIDGGKPIKRTRKYDDDGFLDRSKTFNKKKNKDKIVFSKLRSKGHCNTPYIDDSLLVSKTFSGCQSNIIDTVQLLDHLGFTIHPDKSVLQPTQIIVFLGFVINSITMCIRVTTEKADNIIKLCSRLILKKEITIREFAQVIGKLVATEPGVQYAPLYIKSLEITKDLLLKQNYGNFDAKMTLSDGNISDLNWWVNNINSSFKPMTLTDPQFILNTDSSNTGWGAVVQDTLFKTKGFWSNEEQKNHINFLELKAAYLALIWFCSSRNNVHSDWEDIAKGGPGSSRHDISGTIVEHSELVSTNTSSDCGTVIHNKQSKKSSVSTPESNKGASFSEIAISSFQDIGEILQNYGLSKESSEIIIASWKPATRQQYWTYFKRWLLFCSEREINSFKATELNVLEFLTSLYKIGLGYSAINTARSQRLQTIHSLDLDDITVTDSNIYIDVRSLLKCSKPGRHLQPIELPAFIEDKSLCIVTVLKEYLARTSCFRKTQKLILSCIKPYSHVSKDTLGRWVKIVLQSAGVDITIYKPHSTRSASTSAALRCATSIDTILKAAGWSNESTFRKFYDKPVSKQNYNDNYSVKVLRSHILSNADKSHV
ncbi:unnamed protein product [Mytilus edulis]|uniref:Tyr recombinase domain-containing protein n=1 Tax=Mytilus edulis TaxID=6550 RepID=A0A8S3SU83_MYTED|nr:unnamed protein product [Mytilus edulis]